MQGNNQYKFILSLPGDQEDQDLHQFTNHCLIPLDPSIIVQNNINKVFFILISRYNPADPNITGLPTNYEYNFYTLLFLPF